MPRNVIVSIISTMILTFQKTELLMAYAQGNDKAAEKPLGVMIQMFENERPIQKCRPEWEDVDNIVKYITIYFLGHLCKMLKIFINYVLEVLNKIIDKNINKNTGVHAPANGEI